jgi:CheY-like chemotaxis protein
MPQAYELIGDALAGALRGADLTQRLLAFARRQPLHPRRVETNQLITGMARLLDRLLGEDIQVVLELADDLWPIVADAAQIESTLANLAANARDAMPSGGRLRIVTSNQHFGTHPEAPSGEVSPGDYVVIEITDTGAGMSAEVAAHIFEPFFSTKGTGKGTGLGLSMVFGFINQSGGHITLRSAPGAGTTLRLYLPRADGGAVEAVVPAAIRVPRRAAGETVLVVEDNDTLRWVVLRQLADLGYRAVAARDAVEALDRLEQGDIELLFTDIVMPGELDGFGLARQVRQRWPAIRIVLTSGFPDARLPSDAVETHALRMLIKPYRREDLAEVLHAALRATSETIET